MKNLFAHIPYTVALFAVGGALALLFPSFGPIVAVSGIAPQSILTLFLPILITAAAYGIRPADLRSTLPAASLLALPGVIVAAVLTAAAMMLSMGWSWHYAIIFGALISATDPVAVIAILKAQRVDARLERLIDAEAMLNDGTGIVLFMVALSSLRHPLGEALVVILGGAAVGLIISQVYRLVTLATKRWPTVQALAQPLALIALAYATYIVADSVLKLSGVIALVAYAAVASNEKKGIAERTQQLIDRLWDRLSLVANTVIFLLIGVLIVAKAEPTVADIPKILIAFAVVNIARAIMVAALYPILRKLEGTTPQEAIITTWSGLRGAVALALALVVAAASTQHIPANIQREILILTGGVITLSLFINATTIKWLIKELGVVRP